MKLALASDLHVDCYPDDQQIDWHLVRRWTGVDILVIGGNTSGSPEHTALEVLAARQAFDCVIFVEGNHEHQDGRPVPEGMEILRQFAAQHEGVHYLDGEEAVLVGHTLVCGISGWHVDQAALLAQCVREAAADQTVHEIVVVTHMAPHPDGLASTGDIIESADLLVPIWSDCLDGGKLTVWCFGHSPHPLDFTDSGVRFVCNPRGYPGQSDHLPYSVHLIDTSALTGDEWGEVL
jgi:hypothetical protein